MRIWVRKAGFMNWFWRVYVDGRVSMWESKRPTFTKWGAIHAARRKGKELLKDGGWEEIEW